MLQLKALLMSVCSLSLSLLDLISLKHLVSSAKMNGIVSWICSGKSLIKMTNSKDPSTLPWETQDKALHSIENESPTLTYW